MDYIILLIFQLYGKYISGRHSTLTLELDIPKGHLDEGNGLFFRLLLLLFNIIDIVKLVKK